jgi:hypothetical protein
VTLTQSEIRRGGLYRPEQFALQNTLRCYKIACDLEHPIVLRGAYHCEKDGKFYDDDFETYPCPRCGAICTRIVYPLDCFIPELNLDLELDGKIHQKKGRMKKDYERDEYIAGIGINIWRVDSRTSPIEIAEAVSLMLKFARGK